MFYVYYSLVFSLLNNVARAVAAWHLNKGRDTSASIMAVKGSTDEGAPICPNASAALTLKSGLFAGAFIMDVKGPTPEESPILPNASAASILKIP